MTANKNFSNYLAVTTYLLIAIWQWIDNPSISARPCLIFNLLKVDKLGGSWSSLGGPTQCHAFSCQWQSGTWVIVCWGQYGNQRHGKGECSQRGNNHNIQVIFALAKEGGVTDNWSPLRSFLSLQGEKTSCFQPTTDRPGETPHLLSPTKHNSYSGEIGF